jgi:thiamine pyrophosphokinase
MAGDVMIIHTKGLKYPVANKMLPVDTPYFISNVYTETEVEIETQGWVAVIHPEI